MGGPSYKQVKNAEPHGVVSLHREISAGASKAASERRDLDILAEPEELSNRADDSDLGGNEAGREGNDNGPLLEEKLQVKTAAGGHKEEPK